MSFTCCLVDTVNYSIDVHCPLSSRSISTATCRLPKLLIRFFCVLRGETLGAVLNGKHWPIPLFGIFVTVLDWSIGFEDRVLSYCSGISVPPTPEVNAATRKFPA